MNMYYVYERRGLREFLKEVSQLYDVWLFTAACKEYADAILEKIDPEKTLFSKRLYRENCVIDENAGLLKDLGAIDGLSLQDTVLVYDDARHLEHNFKNTISISRFRSDMSPD